MASSANHFLTYAPGGYAAHSSRRTLALALVAIVGSLAVAALVLLTQALSIVALLVWAVLLAIAWRPRIGLYVAFGLILLFEAGGADQLMLPGAYFQGGLGAMLGLTGISSSPLELLLVLIFVVWLAQGAARRQLSFRGGRLGWPMLLFTLALLLGLMRGIAGGGNFSIALWESRYLFYTVLCYVLAANTVRTYRHVATFTTIMLVASGLYAIEGAYRRVALIDTNQLGVIPEFAYSHESVIFLGALMLLVLAQAVFGAPFWQRLLGLLVLPVAAYTLLATERRAGYIALVIGFIAYTLVFLVAHRKAFFALMLPMLIAFAIYLPLFWNNTTMLGQPARAIRSLSQPDPRDAASNLYRDLELVNVRATIKANPIVGVGFGREYDFVVPLPDLSWWPFWHYEPHHNILYIWLKLGGIGFVIFWVVIGTALARAAYVVRVVRRPEARVFALLTLAGILMTLAFLYVDLGLRSGRVTVFLGMLLGTLSVLDQLTD